MKEKEEDEERNENICRHTINQVTENSKAEATLSTVVCGSSGSGPIFRRLRWLDLHSNNTTCRMWCELNIELYLCIRSEWSYCLTIEWKKCYKDIP